MAGKKLTSPYKKQRKCKPVFGRQGHEKKFVGMYCLQFDAPRLALLLWCTIHKYVPGKLLNQIHQIVCK